MARSVENRRNALALMGFDALKMRYDGEGEGAFRPKSIATTCIPFFVRIHAEEKKLLGIWVRVK